MGKKHEKIKKKYCLKERLIISEKIKLVENKIFFTRNLNKTLPKKIF